MVIEFLRSMQRRNRWIAERALSALYSTSYKARLRIVFLSLTAMVVVFSCFLISEDQRLETDRARVTIQANQEMATFLRMREILSQINRSFQNGEVNNREVEKLQEFTRKFLVQESKGGEKKEILTNLLGAINDYARILQESTAGPDFLNRVLVKHDEVAVLLGALAEQSQLRLLRLEEKTRWDLQRFWGISFSLLILFMSGLVVLGNKLIALIMAPFSSFVMFIDGLNLEEDLPARLPQFGTAAPEVTRVARSFERLLQRLRGYRTLNVRRLLLEKRRADVIATAIADGIFLLRGGQEIIYSNPVGEAILRLSANGSLPTKLSDLLPKVEEEPGRRNGAEEGFALVEAIDRAVTLDVPVELNVVLNGQKMYYLIRAVPITFDVVEHAENSLSNGQRNFLERFQADLIIVAQDITVVREGQEAKKHFMGTLSHEIKTPITSLTMATRLLKKNIDEISNPIQRSLVLTCVSEVDRLRILLDELLNISRFDTLTQKVNLNPSDLARLVRHTMQSFHLEADQKKISISDRFEFEGPLYISMDSTKIAWAISILFTNALRHTPVGGKVSVSLRQLADEVEIQVSDSGQNIAENRRKKIFDRFNSFYDLRMARSGGLGVGLAIVREIVVAHGGSISVANAGSGGAVFSVILPVSGRKEPQVRKRHAEMSDGLSGSNVLTEIKGASFGKNSGR